jgi:hypothetical protein
MAQMVDLSKVRNFLVAIANSLVFSSARFAHNYSIHVRHFSVCYLLHIMVPRTKKGDQCLNALVVVRRG